MYQETNLQTGLCHAQLLKCNYETVHQFEWVLFNKRRPRSRLVMYFIQIWYVLHNSHCTVAEKSCPFK